MAQWSWARYVLGSAAVEALSPASWEHGAMVHVTMPRIDSDQSGGERQSPNMRATYHTVPASSVPTLRTNSGARRERVAAARPVGMVGEAHRSGGSGQKQAQGTDHRRGERGRGEGRRTVGGHLLTSVQAGQRGVRETRP